MKIQMSCPSCGKIARVADEYAGRQVRCPGCQHKFKVVSGQTSQPRDTLPSAPATLPESHPHEQVAASGSTVGTQLGRFVIREKVGVGAFGAVFRAFDSQLQREVALKVPQDHLLNEPRVIERFLREAKAAARLQHPNIVPIYDTGQEGAHHYIASAFIHGRTLAAVLESEVLTYRQIAELVQQLASAMAHAHELGIVHRDIKPANVMVDTEGRAHLMDFGLAFRAEGADQRTHVGAVIGTPAYMAPEQAQGQGDEPLPESDQYSLGVVLYELLTGEVPFHGPAAIVLYNVLNKQPAPPRQVQPAVPADLETICLKAMAKKPEERYASCQDLADDLRRWLDGEPIHARRHGLLERTWRWGRRNPVVAGLSAMTVICLVIVGVVATASLGRLQESRAQALLERQRGEEKANEAKANAQRARESAQQALLNAEKLHKAEKEADEKAKLVERLKLEADHKAATKIKTREESRLREQEARLGLYRGHLRLATAALEENRPKLASSWLERACTHAPEENDARDWNWELLWRRCGKGAQVLPAHTGGVTAVAVAPIGLHLASAGADKAVKLWELATGKPRLTLVGHTDVITALVFTPDGQRLISASKDSTVRYWEVASGAMIRVLRGHTAPVLCLALSSDGKTLATGSEDHTIKLWDVAEASEEATLSGHTGSVRAVAFRGDGKTLATGSSDNTVKLWDVRLAKERITLKGHTRPVTALAFSSVKRGLLVSGSEDQSIRIWTVEPAAQNNQLRGHLGTIHALAFSRDDLHLVSASDDHTVRLWSMPKFGTTDAIFVRHTGSVTGVAFCPGDRMVVTGSADGTMRLWATSVVAERRITTPPDQTFVPGQIAELRLQGEAVTTVEVGPRQGMQQLDLATGQIRRSLRLPPAPRWSRLLLTPDGKRLVAATETSIRLLDASSGKELLMVAKTGEPVVALQVNPEGNLLSWAEQSTFPRIWNVLQERETGRMQGALVPGITYTLAFNSGNKMLASGGSDRIVYVWNLATQRELFKFPGHTEQIFQVLFTPDNKRVMSVSEKGIWKIWDLGTKKDATPPGLPVLSARIAPQLSRDGKMLLTVSADQTVTLWDLATMVPCVRIPTIDKAMVCALCFSDDQKRVLVAYKGVGLRLLQLVNE